MNKDKIIEEQKKTIAEAWDTIEYLESLVHDLHYRVHFSGNMYEDRSYAVNEWAVL